METLQEKFKELKSELERVKACKAEVYPRYKELNEMDNNGYSTDLNSLVNNRSKAEEREFNQLGKLIIALNYQIRGLQLQIIDVGKEILNKI